MDPRGTESLRGSPTGSRTGSAPGIGDRVIAQAPQTAQRVAQYLDDPYQEAVQREQTVTVISQ